MSQTQQPQSTLLSDQRSRSQHSAPQPLAQATPATQAPGYSGTGAPPPPPTAASWATVGPHAALPPQRPDPPPYQAAPVEPANLHLRLVLVTLVAAFIGNLALREVAANTIVMSISVLAASVALFATGCTRTRASRVMLFAAIVFGSFLSLRTEPRLIVFDLIAAFVLLIGAATFGRGGSPFDVGPIRFLAETTDTVGSWLMLTNDIPADAAARSRRKKERILETGSGRVPVTGRVMRGLALALPIVFLLGRLLISADEVFASFFKFETNIAGIGLGHVLVTLLVATALIALQRKSSRDSLVTPGSLVSFAISKVEAIIVLGSINTLFALFATSQLYAMTGAADRILQDADLTVKDYARQGFFQLLWVAGITLLVIVSVWQLRKNDQANRGETAQSQKDPVVFLSYLSTILTMGIVGDAMYRLSLYISWGGLTPLRFYSSAFCVWIIIAFGLAMVRISGRNPHQSWLAPTLLVSGLLSLFALNVANPEAIIATYNLDLYSISDGDADSDGDAEYSPWTNLAAERLTGDGQLVLIEGAHTLPIVLRVNLKTTICVESNHPAQDRGLLGYNRAEADVRKAKAEFCGW